MSKGNFYFHKKFCNETIEFLACNACPTYEDYEVKENLDTGEILYTRFVKKDFDIVTSKVEYKGIVKNNIFSGDKEVLAKLNKKPLFKLFLSEKEVETYFYFLDTDTIIDMVTEGKKLQRVSDYLQYIIDKMKLNVSSRQLLKIVDIMRANATGYMSGYITCSETMDSANLLTVFKYLIYSLSKTEFNAQQKICQQFENIKNIEWLAGSKVQELLKLSVALNKPFNATWNSKRVERELKNRQTDLMAAALKEMEHIKVKKYDEAVALEKSLPKGWKVLKTKAEIYKAGNYYHNCTYKEHCDDILNGKSLMITIQDKNISEKDIIIRFTKQQGKIQATNLEHKYNNSAYKHASDINNVLIFLVKLMEACFDIKQEEISLF